MGSSNRPPENAEVNIRSGGELASTIFDFNASIVSKILFLFELSEFDM